MMQVFILILQKLWGSEKLSNLPQATHVVIEAGLEPDSSL